MNIVDGYTVVGGDVDVVEVLSYTPDSLYRRLVYM